MLCTQQHTWVRRGTIPGIWKRQRPLFRHLDLTSLVESLCIPEHCLLLIRNGVVERGLLSEECGYRFAWASTQGLNDAAG